MKMIKQPTIPPMPKRPTFDARDTQYNLPIGTDLISRQAAIDAIEAEKIKHGNYLTSSYVGYEMAEKVVKQLPPIQPEIVRCEECLYRKICSWEKQGAKFCSFAEKREVTT